MYNRIPVLVSILFLSLFFTNALATQIPLDSTAKGGAGAFTGLLLESNGNPDVGIVLMHGRTSTPDGPVVKQLRNAFNSAGYTTLSIDNPRAATDENMDGDFRDFNDYLLDVTTVNFAFPETYARIRTATAHLQSLGVTKIVLAGFSMGSRFTSAHFPNGQQAGDLPIVGYIGIGMYANSTGPLNHKNNMLAITVPVLDIYGDEDTNSVNSANARSAAYAGADYTTHILDCAVGLSLSECHQLSGLKSISGEACEILESKAINWITTKVPLATSQGLGICASAPTTPSSGGGGGSISYLLALFMLCPLFFVVNKTRRFRLIFQVKRERNTESEPSVRVLPSNGEKLKN